MKPVEQQELFEQWIREHGAILHHVANGFAEGADRKDLMQELLLAIWKSIPAFRNDAHASTFVYRVSHNAALTWKRNERNYRIRFEGLQADVAIEAPARDDTREQQVLEHLYAEIRKLVPVDRSLVLMMLDGLSYAEMARIQGLTESNVGVRLHRLKQKLTDAMKGFTL